MKKENLKSKKGITLIALIITIIVMLILVGVTVATISDGGIFEKAKTAVEKTEEQVIHETIIGAMVLKPDGKIDVKATGDAVIAVLQEQGKTVTFSQETDGFGSLKVNGSNGKTDTYKITETEIDKVTNPWIALGLSPNWTFGKWYGEYDSKGEFKPFMILYEDGSYEQDEVGKVSEEAIKDFIAAGAFEAKGIDFIAIGQWRCRLNSDGTVTRNLYGDGTYNGQEVLYVLEQ